MEELGYYDPVKKKTYLNFDRIIERVKQGAKPTETVLALITKDLCSRRYERKFID
jgi:ribosomal protein S16